MAGFQDTDPCMICYVPVGVRTPDGEIESWSALPCGHHFGSYCVKRWLGLAEQPGCPICRTPMVHACGHPVLPLPAVASDNENSDKAGGDGYNDSDSRVTKKLALVSQNAPTASHMNAPAAAGCPDSAAPGRSLSRFRRKRRLSIPGFSSGGSTRVPLDTQEPCEFCSMSLVKQQAHDGSPGSVVRLAFRVFTPHSRSNSHGQNNTENAYWERWRRDNSTAFSEWWAAQQPPTEPARELPAQGWVM